MKQPLLNLTPTTPKGLTRAQDALLRAAAPLMLLGAFTTPMLVFRVGGATIADLCFAAAGSLVLLSGGRPKLLPQPLVIAAIALGAIATALASLSAIDASASVAVGLRLLYVWTLWQYSTRVIGFEPEKLSSFSLCYALGAAASGLAAIAQTVAHVQIPGSQAVFGRVSGLATHVNAQGGALAAGSAIAFALFLMSYRRLFSAVALVLCLVGLVLAGSITGMLGATVGILAVMIVRGVRLRTFIWLAVAGSATWFIGSQVQSFLPSAANPLERFRQTTGNSGVYGDVGTLALRIYTDQFAWGKIKANPLTGYGLDSASGFTYDGQTATHNMLLLVWFQGGLLLLLAVLLVLTSASLRALAKQNRRTTNGVVAIGAIAAAFAFSMTGPVLFDRFFWLPVVLGLALPLGTLTKPKMTSTEARTQSFGGAQVPSTKSL
jgi:O-antigen ligase